MQGSKEAKRFYRLIRMTCWALFLPLIGFSQGLEFPVGESPDGSVRATLEALDKQIMVGKPFRAQLEVVHPADMVVIFPDTGGGFAPFELQRRSPEPTRTEDGISIDFAMYNLWTWEVDSLQYLQLPIGYIKGEDTLYLLSNSEQLNFVPTLPMDNDSLAFKRIENLAPVGEPVEWGFWAAFFAVLIILLGIGARLLYKPIRKWLRRRRIEREWKRYQLKLQKVQGHLSQPETYLLELAKVWKGYFDRDWKRGLGSLSTRELVDELKGMESITQDNKSTLYQLNRTADRVTYGGEQLPEPELTGYYNRVSNIMTLEYRRRKEAAEL